MDEVVLTDAVLTPEHVGLRRKYSEMSRLKEIGLKLVQVDKFSEKSLKMEIQEIYRLHFVK